MNKKMPLMSIGNKIPKQNHHTVPPTRRTIRGLNDRVSDNSARRIEIGRSMTKTRNPPPATI